MNVDVCMMNIKPNSYRDPLWAVVLTAVMGLMLSLGSCGHDSSQDAGRDAHYLEMDSALDRMNDVDSLAAMVESCRERNDVVGEVLALRHQGRMLRGMSMFKDAIEVQSSGLELATELADTIEMARALNDLAVNYRRLGELSTANSHHFRALKLCDTYSDKKSNLAIKCRTVALCGIGEIEIQLRNYNVADSMLREALEGERLMKNYRGLAINYANLGSIKYGRGEIDSAWVYYRNAMECNMQAGDAGGVAWCHLNFGKLHEYERRYSHAEDEYQQAYNELKRLDKKWFWLECCLALARVSLKLGEEEEASNYLTEAEAEALRINSKEHQAEAYKIHCELAMAQNNPEEAFKYFVKSDEMFDSIRGQSMDEEMSAQRIDYERGRNSGEVNVLNNDIARLKRTRNIMVVLGVLLTMMAAAIIASLVYAVRVRANSQRVLRQIEETRSLFFTNVVHQLRTPLTAIMGAIDDIMTDAGKQDEKAFTGSQRESMEVIERQGNHLLELVDRILKVGSVRSAIRGPEWRTGDAVPMIRMIVESYREYSVERHIELSYAPQESSEEIDTVPDYLKTILECLIENAINYSRDFSKVTVLSRIEGPDYVISVVDDGMGIGEEDLPHVFEAFYRGAAAERIIDGVGIGLTVVRDMAMAMGGDVAVKSVKGQGSVFTVNLPCKHESGNKVKARFDQVMSTVSAKVKPRRRALVPDHVDDQEPDKPVILVVEDHNDVAREVGKVFASRYTVHYAADGEQGYKLACELVPQLIITDIKMPVMDGYQLCAYIKNTERLSHIPVIMLSARTSKEDRILGIKSGADAYLVKPFVREELVAWAERLIESRQQLQEQLAALQAQQAENEKEKEKEKALAAKKSSYSDASDVAFLNMFNKMVEDALDQGVSKLNLDAIALSFKMGESQLRRHIHYLTGKTMTAYLTELRMERAMRLLREDPDIMIGDVAEKCGYGDVAYFSRVFRQYHGMTPSVARNNATE